MLRERGIQGMLLDLDNTLCPWGSREVTPARREWIERAKSHFKLCIVSNTFKGRRLHAVGADLGLPTVARWGLGRKPGRGGILAGLKLIETTPGESVIIGDQIFADILGGNRAGLLTIWIPPLDPHEFISTWLMRGVERAVLRQLRVVIPSRPESVNG